MEREVIIESNVKKTLNSNLLFEGVVYRVAIDGRLFNLGLNFMTTLIPYDSNVYDLYDLSSQQCVTNVDPVCSDPQVCVRPQDMCPSSSPFCVLQNETCNIQLNSCVPASQVCNASDFSCIQASYFCNTTIDVCVASNLACTQSGYTCANSNNVCNSSLVCADSANVCDDGVCIKNPDGLQKAGLGMFVMVCLEVPAAVVLGALIYRAHHAIGNAK